MGTREDVLNFVRGTFILLLTLLLGYTAVYAGDGAAFFRPTAYVAKWWAEEEMQGLVMGIGGTGILSFFFSAFILAKRYERRYEPKTYGYLVAALGFVCASFVFGYIATPWKSYGLQPWHWVQSRQFIVVAIAFCTPLLMFIEDTLNVFRK